MSTTSCPCKSYKGDHYVHGTVQYGVYSGMRQEESAIDAEVLLSRGFNTEELALFESSRMAATAPGTGTGTGTERHQGQQGQAESGSLYVCSGNGLYYDNQRSREHADRQILKAVGVGPDQKPAPVGLSGADLLVVQASFSSEVKGGIGSSSRSPSTAPTSPPIDVNLATPIGSGGKELFVPIHSAGPQANRMTPGQGGDSAISNPGGTDLEGMSVFGRYRALRECL